MTTTMQVVPPSKWSSTLWTVGSPYIVFRIMQPLSVAYSLNPGLQSLRSSCVLPQPPPSHTRFQSTKIVCIHCFCPFPILNYSLFSWVSSAALVVRSCIVSVLPRKLAIYNGVMPNMFLAPIEAPLLRSSPTTPV